MIQVVMQPPASGPQLERMPGQTHELSAPTLDQRRIAWNMILSEAYSPSTCSIDCLTRVYARQADCQIEAVINETADYAS